MAKKIRDIWGLYLVIPFFLAGAAGFFLFKKGEVELIVNHHFTAGADLFFRMATWGGNGVVFAALLIFFLFYRYYFSLLTLLVIILQTLVVQALKLVVFPGMERPALFFSKVPGIHYVEGVKMNMLHSFPSGHAATAFSVATLLFLACKNRKLSFAWYGSAIVIAFSRVYLLQHFFIDIFSGAAIGIIVTFSAWYFLERIPFGNKDQLEKSLRSVFH